MRNQQGFTMIEVLIAMLILAIGLLGVAGVQTLSLKMNNNANIRSQISYYADNIVEVMRADVKGVKAGEYDNIDSSKSTVCGSCTSGSVADQAVTQWNRELQANIPSAQEKVTVNGGVAKVVITWTERNEGGGGAPKTGVATQTYTLIARIINV